MIPVKYHLPLAAFGTWLLGECIFNLMEQLWWPITIVWTFLVLVVYWDTRR
jgi:hypothetical protein